MSQNLVNNIHFDLMIADLRASHKKQVIEELAEAIAGQVGYPAASIAGRMLTKEQATSSAIGGGVAIHHARFMTLKKPCIALARLKMPMAFDAFDSKPVDLVCMLVSPLGDGALHLQRLARLSRMMKNRSLRARLREAADAETMQAIAGPEAVLAAAA